MALAIAALGLGACSKPGDAPRSPPSREATPATPATAAPSRGPGPTPIATLSTPTSSDMTAPAASGQDATSLASPAPADADHAGGIAWKLAASDADVDAAFAAARAETKPVFVYWGAKWCPPCNQVKATIFNRRDFIERSRAFVPVYVDGDGPGAQKLGARFHVSGYPTMLLFSPSGDEVTRLPGEVDPARYTEVLNLGMNAARPVKAVLADALAGGKTLRADDWRLLAFYSFDADEQLVSKDKVAPTLARLAEACPADQAATAMRLRLKSLAAADAKAPLRGAAGVRPAVLAMLGQPAAAREEADQLINESAEIVRALSARGTPERARLLQTFDVALKRLQADATLSRADRMQALIGRVDLTRIDMPSDDSARAGRARPVALPAMPDALLADVREQAARADREISDAFERQAVITAAAYMLERSGLSSESDVLLMANLARSHSPYYLMSKLAGNARKRGDKAGALHWYREAFEKSEGPATRLQWGASYVGALVELAPADESAIESTTVQLWREAAVQSDAFYERSGRSLQRVGARLLAWNRGGEHAAVMARLRGELSGLCTKGERGVAERKTCARLLTPSAKPSA